MTVQLEIHEASTEERKQIYANVFDFWQWADTVEEHVRLRLQSAQHQRARWYAGYADGKIVSSLGAYPLEFVLDGVEVPGISIGSVHTLKAYRGQGLVPQLMQRVEQIEAERGSKLSILYSDIDPKYYGRLGYQLCPSRQLSLAVTAGEQLKTSSFELAPLDADANRASLQQVYDRCVRQHDVAILRDDNYWAYVIKKCQDDSFYELLKEGESVGYVLAGADGMCLKIRDYATIDELSITNWFRALSKVARARDLGEIGGWLPDCSYSMQFYKERSSEITMIKHLTDGSLLKQRHFDACDAFREIDHV